MIYASQTFHDPTCPDFTDAELLAIYDSYEDRYFWPEDKFCILYSYFRSIQNHGINGMPHKGYGMTLTSLACNYPSWFWNDVTEM